jgi:dGTPase
MIVSSKAMDYDDQGAFCNAILASYASKPFESRGRFHEEKESLRRSPFERDRDRVIHSRSFRRLQHKTQVFIHHEGDHYRTRLTHSIEVAQVARSIARSLRLNEDLTETIALAHDLGHPPFAHLGEDVLLECLKEIGEPSNRFNHNEQTFRLVTELEKTYPDFNGLNLTWETLEGIAKHNGPIDCNSDDGYLDFILSYCQNFDLMPSLYPSAEAQVADAADGIAYNSHDLDDGLRAGFFTMDDLYDLDFVKPIINKIDSHYTDLSEKQKRGEIIREVMGSMIMDLIETSLKTIQSLGAETVNDIRNAGKNVIGFSEEYQKHDQELRSFLMGRLYKAPAVLKTRDEMGEVVRNLFFGFYNNPDLMPLSWKEKIKTEGHLTVVLDYISGMTDNYAINKGKSLPE